MNKIIFDHKNHNSQFNDNILVQSLKQNRRPSAANGGTTSSQAIASNSSEQRKENQDPLKTVENNPLGSI